MANIRRICTRAFLASIYAILLLSTTCPPANSSDQDKPRTYIHTWKAHATDDQFVNLEARLVPDQPDSFNSMIQIYRDGNKIFSYDPGLFPEGFIPLHDGNLAALWSHANGAIMLGVFGYRKGAVRQLITAECGKLYPEFVFQNVGTIMNMGTSDEYSRRVNPFVERILVPHTEWKSFTPARGGRKSDYLPISVDIYTWDEKLGQYKVNRNVPWEKRLKSL